MGREDRREDDDRIDRVAIDEESDEELDQLAEPADLPEGPENPPPPDPPVPLPAVSSLGTARSRRSKNVGSDATKKKTAVSGNAQRTEERFSSPTRPDEGKNEDEGKRGPRTYPSAQPYPEILPMLSARAISGRKPL